MRMGRQLRGVAYGLGALSALYLASVRSWLPAAAFAGMSLVGIALEISLELRR